MYIYLIKLLNINSCKSICCSFHEELAAGNINSYLFHSDDSHHTADQSCHLNSLIDQSDIQKPIVSQLESDNAVKFNTEPMNGIVEKQINEAGTDQEVLTEKFPYRINRQGH